MRSNEKWTLKYLNSRLRLAIREVFPQCKLQWKQRKWKDFFISSAMLIAYLMNFTMQVVPPHEGFDPDEYKATDRIVVGYSGRFQTYLASLIPLGITALVIIMKALVLHRNPVKRLIILLGISLVILFLVPKIPIGDGHEMSHAYQDILLEGIRKKMNEMLGLSLNPETFYPKVFPVSAAQRTVDGQNIFLHPPSAEKLEVIIRDLIQEIRGHLDRIMSEVGENGLRQMEVASGTISGGNGTTVPGTKVPGSKFETRTSEIKMSEILTLDDLFVESRTFLEVVRDSKTKKKIYRETPSVIANPRKWKFFSQAQKDYALRLSKMSLDQLREEAKKYDNWKRGVDVELDRIVGEGYYYFIAHVINDAHGALTMATKPADVTEAEMEIAMMREIFYRLDYEVKPRSHSLFVATEPTTFVPPGPTFRDRWRSFRQRFFVHSSIAAFLGIASRMEIRSNSKRSWFFLNQILRHSPLYKFMENYVLASGVEPNEAKRILDQILLEAPIRIKWMKLPGIVMPRLTGFRQTWSKVWAEEAEHARAQHDLIKEATTLYLALTFLNRDESEYQPLKQRLVEIYPESRRANHGETRVHVEPMEILAHHSITPAYLILPEASLEQDQIAVAILIHGITDLKENAYFNLLEKKLIQRNIAVLRIALPGHGDHNGFIEGDSELIKQVQEMIEQLKRQPLVRGHSLRAGPIGIVGQSLGGSTGLHLLDTELEGLIKKVILYNPPLYKAFQNPRDLMFMALENLETIIGLDDSEKIFLTLQSLAEPFKNLDRLKRYRKKILAFTGTKDFIIPKADRRSLEEALPILAYDPPAYFSLQGQGHFFTGPDQEFVFEETARQLDYALNPRAERRTEERNKTTRHFFRENAKGTVPGTVPDGDRSGDHSEVRQKTERVEPRTRSMRSIEAGSKGHPQTRIRRWTLEEILDAELSLSPNNRAKKQIRVLDLGAAGGSFQRNFKEQLRARGYQNIETLGVERDEEFVKAGREAGLSLLLGEVTPEGSLVLSRKNPKSWVRALQPQSFDLVTLNAPPRSLGTYIPWLKAAKLYVKDDGIILIRLRDKQLETTKDLESRLLRQALKNDPEIVFQALDEFSTPKVATGVHPLGPLTIVKKSEHPFARNYSRSELRTKRQPIERIDRLPMSWGLDADGLDKLYRIYRDAEWLEKQTRTGMDPPGRVCDSRPPVERYQELSQSLKRQGIQLPSFEKMQRFLNLLSLEFLLDLIPKARIVERDFRKVIEAVPKTSDRITASDLEQVLLRLSIAEIDRLLAIAEGNSVAGLHEDFRKRFRPVKLFDDIAELLSAKKGLRSSILNYHNSRRSYEETIKLGSQRLKKRAETRLTQNLEHFRYRNISAGNGTKVPGLDLQTSQKSDSHFTRPELRTAKTEEGGEEGKEKALEWLLENDSFDFLNKLFSGVQGFLSVFAIKISCFIVFGFETLLLNRGQHLGKERFNSLFLSTKLMKKYFDALMARRVLSLAQEVSLGRIKHRIVGSRNGVPVLFMLDQEADNLKLFISQPQAAFNELILLFQRIIPSSLIRVWRGESTEWKDDVLIRRGEMSIPKREIGLNEASAIRMRTEEVLAPSTTTATSISDSGPAVPRALDPKRMTASTRLGSALSKAAVNSSSADFSDLDNRINAPSTAKVYPSSQSVSKTQNVRRSELRSPALAQVQARFDVATDLLHPRLKLLLLFVGYLSSYILRWYLVNYLPPYRSFISIRAMANVAEDYAESYAYFVDPNTRGYFREKANKNKNLQDKFNYFENRQDIKLWQSEFKGFTVRKNKELETSRAEWRMQKRKYLILGAAGLGILLWLMKLNKEETELPTNPQEAIQETNEKITHTARSQSSALSSRSQLEQMYQSIESRRKDLGLDRPFEPPTVEEIEREVHPFKKQQLYNLLSLEYADVPGSTVRGEGMALIPVYIEWISIIELMESGYEALVLTDIQEATGEQIPVDLTISLAEGKKPFPAEDHPYRDYRNRMNEVKERIRKRIYDVSTPEGRNAVKNAVKDALNLIRPELRSSTTRSFIEDEIFPGQLNILENFLKQTFSKVFTLMKWNNGRAAVWMTKENVAAFLANFLKVQLLKNADDLSRFKRSQTAQQAIRISWRPTKRSGLGAAFWTLIQSLIASLMRFINSGRVRAWVWQPRKVGTDPTSKPSSSSSINTRYSRFISSPARKDNTVHRTGQAGIHSEDRLKRDALLPRAELRTAKTEEGGEEPNAKGNAKGTVPGTVPDGDRSGDHSEVWQKTERVELRTRSMRSITVRKNKELEISRVELRTKPNLPGTGIYGARSQERRTVDPALQVPKSRTERRTGKPESEEVQKDEPRKSWILTKEIIFSLPFLAIGLVLSSLSFPIWSTGVVVTELCIRYGFQSLLISGPLAFAVLAISRFYYRQDRPYLAEVLDSPKELQKVSPNESPLNPRTELRQNPQSIHFEMARDDHYEYLESLIYYALGQGHDGILGDLGDAAETYLKTGRRQWLTVLHKTMKPKSRSELRKSDSHFTRREMRVKKEWSRREFIKAVMGTVAAWKKMETVFSQIEELGVATQVIAISPHVETTLYLGAWRIIDPENFQMRTRYAQTITQALEEPEKLTEETYQLMKEQLLAMRGGIEKISTHISGLSLKMNDPAQKAEVIRSAREAIAKHIEHNKEYGDPEVFAQIEKEVANLSDAELGKWLLKIIPLHLEGSRSDAEEQIKLLEPVIKKLETEEKTKKEAAQQQSDRTTPENQSSLLAEENELYSAQKSPDGTGKQLLKNERFPRLVFFPPSGFQKAGPRGKALYENAQAVREIYARIEKKAREKDLLGPSFNLYQTSFEWSHADYLDPKNTAAVHIAIFAHHVALWESLKEQYFQTEQPAGILGVSRGGHAAYYASGAVSLEDGIELTLRHTKMLQSYGESEPYRRMLFIRRATQEDLGPLLQKYQGVIALKYSSTTFTVSIPKANIQSFMAELPKRSHAKEVPLAVTSHDPLLIPSSNRAEFEKYQNFLINLLLRMQDPKYPLYSSLHPGKILKIREDIVREEIDSTLNGLPLDEVLAKISNAHGIRQMVVLGHDNNKIFKPLEEEKRLPENIQISAIADWDALQNLNHERAESRSQTSYIENPFPNLDPARLPSFFDLSVALRHKYEVRIGGNFDLLWLVPSETGGFPSPLLAETHLMIDRPYKNKEASVMSLNQVEVRSEQRMENGIPFNPKVGDEDETGLDESKTKGWEKDSDLQERLIYHVLHKYVRPHLIERITKGRLLLLGPGRSTAEVEILFKLFPEMESLTLADKSQTNLVWIKKSLEAKQCPYLERIIFHHADLGNLELPSDYFDFAFARGVYDFSVGMNFENNIRWLLSGGLAHPFADEFPKWFKELRRVLKPLGIYLSTDANKQAFASDGFNVSQSQWKHDSFVAAKSREVFLDQGIAEEGRMNAPESPSRTEMRAISLEKPRMVVVNDLSGGMNVARGLSLAYGGKAIVIQEPKWWESERFKDDLVVINSRPGIFTETEAKRRNESLARFFNKTGQLPDIKIDYALREVKRTLEGLYDNLDYDLMFFVPAMPRLGSKTVDAVHWIHWQGKWKPVHQTDLANQSPSRITTSNLIDFLHQELDIPKNKLFPIPIAIVSQGPDAILKWIKNQSPPSGSVILPDAVTNTDLQHIADSIRSLERSGRQRILRVGSSDFLRELMPSPQKKRAASNLTLLKHQGVPLVLIGTVNPATTAQIQFAKQQLGDELDIHEMNIDRILESKEEAEIEIKRLGTDLFHSARMRQHPVILQTTRDFKNLSREQAVEISRSLGLVLRKQSFPHGILSAIFVSGGETFGMMVENLLAMGVISEGKFEDGVMLGTLHGGLLHGIPVVSKQGGMSSKESLIFDFIQQSRSELRTAERRAQKAERTRNQMGIKGSAMRSALGALHRIGDVPYRAELRLQETERTFSSKDIRKSVVTIKKNPGFIYKAAVIGGGGAGTGIFRDLSLRENMSAVLIERGKFAGETSTKSGKTAHAGLWYLRMSGWHLLHCMITLLTFRWFQAVDHLIASFQNFWLVFGGARERKWGIDTTRLDENTYGAVEPTPFIALAFEESRDSKWLIVLGVKIYGWLTRFWSKEYGTTEVYKTVQLLKRFPLNPTGLKVGVRYTDGKMSNDRTWVVQTIRDAVWRSTEDNPIHALNHVEVTGYHWVPGSWRRPGYFEIQLINHLESGEAAKFSIKARTFFNAAGPWIDEVNQKSQDGPQKEVMEGTGGSEIYVTNKAIHEALRDHPDLRVSFIPLFKKRRYLIRAFQDNGIWYYLIGSTDRKQKDLKDIRPEPGEVDELIDAFNKTFSNLPFKISENESLSPFQISRDDVFWVTKGVRPTLKQKKKGENLGDLPKTFKIIKRRHGQGTKNDQGTSYDAAGVKLTELGWAGESGGNKARRTLKRMRIKIGKSKRRETPLLQAPDQKWYAMNRPDYPREDPDFLRDKVANYATYQDVENFDDLMTNAGGLWDAMTFDKNGKPKLNPLTVRFLFNSLAQVQDWNRDQRKKEWRNFRQVYERSMQAVWSPRMELRLNEKVQSLILDLNKDLKAVEALRQLGAMGPGPAEAAIPALIERLQRKDNTLIVSEEIRKTLVKIGWASIPPLIQILENPYSFFRQETAQVLAGFGAAARGAVPALRDILRHCDDYLSDKGPYLNAPNFIATVIWALGQIGPDAKEAVPELIHAMHRKPEAKYIDDSERLRSQTLNLIARDALVKIGPASVPALISVLKDTGSIARYEALEALEKLDAPTLIGIPILIQFVQEELKLGWSNYAIRVAKMIAKIAPAGAAELIAMLDVRKHEHLLYELASGFNEISAVLPALTDKYFELKAKPFQKLGGLELMISEMTAIGSEALIHDLWDRSKDPQTVAQLAVMTGLSREEIQREAWEVVRTIVLQNVSQLNATVQTERQRLRGLLEAYFPTVRPLIQSPEDLKRLSDEIFEGDYYEISEAIRNERARGNLKTIQEVIDYVQIAHRSAHYLSVKKPEDYSSQEYQEYWKALQNLMVKAQKIEPHFKTYSILREHGFFFYNFYLLFGSENFQLFDWYLDQGSGFLTFLNLMKEMRDSELLRAMRRSLEGRQSRLEAILISRALGLGFPEARITYPGNELPVNELVTLGGKFGIGKKSTDFVEIFGGPYKIPNLAKWMDEKIRSGEWRTSKQNQDPQFQLAIGYDTGNLPSQLARARFLSLYLLVSTTERPHLRPLSEATEGRADRGDIGILILGREVTTSFNGQGERKRLDHVLNLYPEMIERSTPAYWEAFLRQNQLLHTGMLLANAEDSFRELHLPALWRDHRMRAIAWVYRNFERNLISLLREFDHYRNPQMIYPLHKEGNEQLNAQYRTDHRRMQSSFETMKLEEVLDPIHSQNWVVPLETNDPKYWNRLQPYFYPITGMMLHQGQVPEEKDPRLNRGLYFIQRMRKLGADTAEAIEDLIRRPLDKISDALPPDRRMDPFIDPAFPEATRDYLERVNEEIVDNQKLERYLPSIKEFRQALIDYQIHARSELRKNHRNISGVPRGTVLASMNKKSKESKGGNGTKVPDSRSIRANPVKLPRRERPDEIPNEPWPDEPERREVPVKPAIEPIPLPEEEPEEVPATTRAASRRQESEDRGQAPKKNLPKTRAEFRILEWLQKAAPLLVSKQLNHLANFVLKIEQRGGETARLLQEIRFLAAEDYVLDRDLLMEISTLEYRVQAAQSRPGTQRTFPYVPGLKRSERVELRSGQELLAIVELDSRDELRSPRLNRRTAQEQLLQKKEQGIPTESYESIEAQALKAGRDVRRKQLFGEAIDLFMRTAKYPHLYDLRRELIRNNVFIHANPLGDPLRREAAFEQIEILLSDTRRDIFEPIVEEIFEWLGVHIGMYERLRKKQNKKKRDRNQLAVTALVIDLLVRTLMVHRDDTGFQEMLVRLYRKMTNRVLKKKSIHYLHNIKTAMIEVEKKIRESGDDPALRELAEELADIRNNVLRGRTLQGTIHKRMRARARKDRIQNLVVPDFITHENQRRSHFSIKHPKEMGVTDPQLIRVMAIPDGDLNEAVRIRKNEGGHFEEVAESLDYSGVIHHPVLVSRAVIEADGKAKPQMSMIHPILYQELLNDRRLKSKLLVDKETLEDYVHIFHVSLVTHGLELLGETGRPLDNRAVYSRSAGLTVQLLRKYFERSIAPQLSDPLEISGRWSTYLAEYNVFLSYFLLNRSAYLGEVRLFIRLEQLRIQNQIGPSPTALETQAVIEHIQKTIDQVEWQSDDLRIRSRDHIVKDVFFHTRIYASEESRFRGQPRPVIFIPSYGRQDYFARATAYALVQDGYVILEYGIPHFGWHRHYSEEVRGSFSRYLARLGYKTPEQIAQFRKQIADDLIEHVAYLKKRHGDIQAADMNRMAFAVDRYSEWVVESLLEKQPEAKIFFQSRSNRYDQVYQPVLPKQEKRERLLMEKMHTRILKEFPVEAPRNELRSAVKGIGPITIPVQVIHASPELKTFSDTNNLPSEIPTGRRELRSLPHGNGTSKQFPTGRRELRHTKMLTHTNARTGQPKGYPKRFPVPEGTTWDWLPANYHPETYTSEKVLENAMDRFTPEQLEADPELGYADPRGKLTQVQQAVGVRGENIFYFDAAILKRPELRHEAFAFAHETEHGASKIIFYRSESLEPELYSMFAGLNNVRMHRGELRQAIGVYGQKRNGRQIHVVHELREVNHALAEAFLWKKVPDIWALELLTSDPWMEGLRKLNGVYQVSDSLRERFENFRENLVVRTSA